MWGGAYSDKSIFNKLFTTQVLQDQAVIKRTKKNGQGKRRVPGISDPKDPNGKNTTYEEKDSKTCTSSFNSFIMCPLSLDTIVMVGEFYSYYPCTKIVYQQ